MSQKAIGKPSNTPWAGLVGVSTIGIGLTESNQVANRIAAYIHSIFCNFCNGLQNLACSHFTQGPKLSLKRTNNANINAS